jgi:predicted DNA-binding transcriptional regulator AlpA
MTTNNDSLELPDMLVSINKVIKSTEIYYTFKGMCEKLGVSLSTGNRWKKEEKLPAPVKINGQVRYRDSDIESMVLKQNPELLAASRTGESAANIVKGL